MMSVTLKDEKERSGIQLEPSGCIRMAKEPMSCFMSSHYRAASFFVNVPKSRNKSNLNISDLALLPLGSRASFML